MSVDFSSNLQLSMSDEIALMTWIRPQARHNFLECAQCFCLSVLDVHKLSRGCKIDILTIENDWKKDLMKIYN